MQTALLCAFALGAIAFFVATVQAADRFPRPEFDSGYVLKTTTHPAPGGLWLEYADVALLAAALALSAWLALRRRSRLGLRILSLACLVYFGFIRQGCVCPVGSYQNVAYAVCGQGYALPLSVLLVFLMPLLAALLWGRVFCGAVCPLGAAQDLAALKPLALPEWFREGLSLLPAAALAFGILLAATGTAFLTCRFDPFVNLFRLSGPAEGLIAAGVMLLAGVFIARPYCRFFCPYGFLLSLFAALSRKRLTVTPDDCVQCRLCEEACPVDAIRAPEDYATPEPVGRGRSRLALVIALLPALVFCGGWLVSGLDKPLSRLNRDVQLAERLALEHSGKLASTTVESRAFRRSGASQEKLIAEAEALRGRLRFGGWFAGGAFGLAVWAKLLSRSTKRRREKYEPDARECLSCVRCLEYCPRERLRRKEDKPA